MNLERGFPGGSVVKNPPANAGDMVRSLGWKDPLEKEMATYSSIHAWKIPWAEEPEGLQSIGSQRVRHDWATSLLLCGWSTGQTVQVGHESLLSCLISCLTLPGGQFLTHCHLLFKFHLWAYGDFYHYQVLWASYTAGASQVSQS